MPDNKVLKVGGVPEHFNLPWHLAIEQGVFEKAGLNVQWQDYPGGTGAMTEALDKGELDIAISLTEGITAKIINGGHFRILENFVTSPLTWGVYVSADASFSKIADLEGQSFAISRMGSGSHLMAFVYAQQNNWRLNEDQLTIAKNLQGMAEALNKHEGDILLWEKYTTQPYVDAGYLKLMDDMTPPWPAFAMAVRNDLIQNRPEELKTLQQVINQFNQSFMEDETMIHELAKRYEMSVKDAEDWFKQTTWATSNQVSDEDLNFVVDTLYDLGLVSEKLTPEHLCSPLTALETNA